ncbi:DUF5343 domain-containing protein [Sphingomonas sabuli]|uniref:DUF5343 domain-containing protein n=1 Tax=Sphingomonas sabuli TaxID=2764186 RepID=A0A7G9L5J9_9SPHN|nr:DUF5343 domain-containing protein [Sphingomonas sabuli]QNM83898.1 DUF5343 domain-containing protein [Sphingomonas sabuli]
MALPKSYLTSVKNLPAILAAIQQAQAPDRFTQAFLESLEFKSSSDRLIIGVLKSLGFLDDSGTPTERYYRFLDQTQAPQVIAEGVRDAYGDLFKVNKSAQTLSRNDLINKFKTLSQGQLSDSVLDKLATTFQALVKEADFSKASESLPEATEEQETSSAEREQINPLLERSRVSLGGMHYNIQLILPDTRDPKVFDALFRSLREHLF